MIYKNISVVIPAYNEAAVISSTVSKIADFFSRLCDNFEIIVVDDASVDDTGLIVTAVMKQGLPVKLLRNDGNRGKGYSVRKGMLEAKYEYILFSDADLSTPIDEVVSFSDYFDKAASIVIGSRALKESKVLKYQGFLRRWMGRFFNVLVNTILFRGIPDTQCGFKCFRKDAATVIFKLQRLDGFCFDVEILHIARKLGYKISQAPVRWYNRENSRVGIINDSCGMFIDLFRIKINDIRGIYAG